MLRINVLKIKQCGLLSAYEEAVRFYTTSAFNNSPAGRLLGPLGLTEGQVLDVSAFLRVINALENVRSSKDLAKRASQTFDYLKAIELMNLSKSEMDDAIEVLSDRALHPYATSQLKTAKLKLDIAALDIIGLTRGLTINSAIQSMSSAQSDGFGCSCNTQFIKRGTYIFIVYIWRNNQFED
jgi:hypothetical protein